MNLYRELILSFTKRNIIGRYQGSILGVMWSFVNPLITLVIYTFIFSVILKVKFGHNGSTAIYGVYLFCGIIPWIAFSETITQSTGVILDNITLVKKTVFPLEILPLVSTLTGFIHSLFGLSILFAAIVVIPGQTIHPTLFLLPLIMIPQLLLTVGLGWFISSLGVYIRDMSEMVRHGLMVWMFLTPIMYPADIVPEKFRSLMFLNPMAVIVESYRDVILTGKIPKIWPLTIVGLTGLFFAFTGYLWFMKSKRGFADVI